MKVANKGRWLFLSGDGLWKFYRIIVLLQSAVSDPKDKTEFLKVVVRCHAISNREIDTGYER